MKYLKLFENFVINEKMSYDELEQMIKECATPQKLTYNLFKIEDFKPETPPDT